MFAFERQLWSKKINSCVFNSKGYVRYSCGLPIPFEIAEVDLVSVRSMIHFALRVNCWFGMIKNDVCYRFLRFFLILFERQPESWLKLSKKSPLAGTKYASYRFAMFWATHAVGFSQNMWHMSIRWISFKTIQHLEQLSSFMSTNRDRVVLQQWYWSSLPKGVRWRRSQAQCIS